MSPEACKYVGCFEEATSVLRVTVAAPQAHRGRPAARIKARWELCDEHLEVLSEDCAQRGLEVEIQRA